MANGTTQDQPITDAYHEAELKGASNYGVSPEIKLEFKKASGGTDDVRLPNPVVSATAPDGLFQFQTASGTPVTLTRGTLAINTNDKNGNAAPVVYDVTGGNRTLNFQTLTVSDVSTLISQAILNLGLEPGEGGGGGGGPPPLDMSQYVTKCKDASGSLDNMLTSGFYHVNAALGGMVNLLVISGSPGGVRPTIQIASDSLLGDVRMRNHYDGSWSDWSTIGGRPRKIAAGITSQFSTWFDGLVVNCYESGGLIHLKASFGMGASKTILQGVSFFRVPIPQGWDSQYIGADGSHMQKFTKHNSGQANDAFSQDYFELDFETNNGYIYLKSKRDAFNGAGAVCHFYIDLCISKNA